VSDPRGEPLYFVSQLEDITLRKQAEEALKKSKSELELRVVARTAELHASNKQLQHELTERVRAEKALQQSEEQFRAIFEHAPVMIGSFTEDGRCNLWNAEGERQLGYTTEEMLAFGDSLSIFYPDQEVRDRVIESIVLTDNTFREFAVRASNDTTRHQMWANFALPNKDVISIGYDITERKLAEERLRKSEELYRALARNLPNGAVFMFDHDLRYQLAEGMTLTSLNYSPQSMIGKTIWEVLPPERCELLVPYYQAALAGQENIIDIEGGNPSRNYRVHFVPVKDEHGETFAGMAVSLDTTEQRRSAEEAQLAQESAEQANRAKSEFLSRMSHELRTPLNSIIGFSQLLEVSNLPAKESKYVTYVLKAGEHLLALINEVLDIASVESGRSNLSMEPVEVRATLQECLDLVEPLTAQRKVSIDTGSSLEQSWHVLADRQRLRQVLLNIIANAIKYNRDGGSVTVSCHVVEGPAEERLRIQVSDTGPGMSEGKLAKLFIPFERLGAELTEVEGSGLGLALSKNLVEAMRGSMGVVSTVGRGSAFWVDLPIAESPMQQIDKLQTGPIIKDGQPLKGRTILYVEDNLSNVKLMEGILEGTSGVRLITAMQGSLAIEIARQERPDLILLDLHLPDINGDEVLRNLQADPRTSAIPVVMVSADATAHQIERLHDAGARDYLTKPLSINRLRMVLDEVLNETT
jgi:PAS domain S-box-containing protein